MAVPVTADEKKWQYQDAAHAIINAEAAKLRMKREPAFRKGVRAALKTIKQEATDRAKAAQSAMP